MLEINNYYIQNIENLTDLFTNIFVIMDDIYNEIIPISIRNRRNIKDSKLSDSEIITISIVGELLTIDSEKSFFSLLKREYKMLFPKLGDRTRFNRTKRNLHSVISKIREYVSEIIRSSSNNLRIIDSMPIFLFVNLEELISVNISKVKLLMEYVRLKKKLILDLNFMHLLR